MVRAMLATEIFFRAPTRVGLLADVTGSLAAAAVNITAMALYDKSGNSEFLMLTSDDAATVAALQGVGGEVKRHGVVVAHVSNTPGALARMTNALAEEGIDIAQLWATTGDGPTAMVILHTANDEKAVSVLNAV